MFSNLEIDFSPLRKNLLKMLLFLVWLVFCMIAFFHAGFFIDIIQYQQPIHGWYPLLFASCSTFLYWLTIQVPAFRKIYDAEKNFSTAARWSVFFFLSASLPVAILNGWIEWGFVSDTYAILLSIGIPGALLLIWLLNQIGITKRPADAPRLTGDHAPREERRLATVCLIIAFVSAPLAYLFDFNTFPQSQADQIRTVPVQDNVRTGYIYRPTVSGPLSPEPQDYRVPALGASEARMLIWDYRDFPGDSVVVFVNGVRLSPVLDLYDRPAVIRVPVPSTVDIKKSGYASAVHYAIKFPETGYTIFNYADSKVGNTYYLEK